MLSKKMEKSLNDQINQEMASAYMYLSMSAYFSTMNMNGFSHWMRIQYEEELTHAGKIVDYLLERDGVVALTSIKAPPRTWKSTLVAVKAAYTAEVQNTKQINVIMDLSIKEADHATRVHLEWFVSEQIEEESTALNVVEQVKLAGNAPGAMFILDRELGARSLTE
jgi:ferritin